MTEHPYIIVCPDHGKTPLTEEQYREQMLHIGAHWTCPLCGAQATFDQQHLEEFHFNYYAAQLELD